MASLAPKERRASMVDRQVAGRGVHDARLLAAMREVPRENFVAEALAEFAYEDSPLPIEAGQTISQPYVVALMVEAAAIRPDDRVLEIGVGSGYAAAVMSRLGRRVHAIDRHAELTDLARTRMARLGYFNVVVRTADGTRGWPENAPFDVILVAAGGPSVPHPLCHQLAIGGRLVIPIGPNEEQRLVRVTRLDDAHFLQEDLGPVRFVPLIGRHGWRGDTHTDAFVEKRPLVEIVADAAEPLPEIDDPDFGAFFDRFGETRIVLLGEASHGASEFYRARAAITRRLIERHGFTIVAMEADWPDGAAIDRHVRHEHSLSDAEPAFQRFPSWTWRNPDIDAFVAWLRDHNARQSPENRTGFHGLDLYNLRASIEAAIEYLAHVCPEAVDAARERYGCLTPWRSAPESYGRMAVSEGYARCEAGVINRLCAMFEHSRQKDAEERDWLTPEQNAQLIAKADAYYRAMYYGSVESWNLRDRHMFDTLDRLLTARGPESKAVVWAHNSHVGDARVTEMGTDREELNIGQLVREHYGSDARLIGFGTHGGTVLAASDWGGPMLRKPVTPSHPDSYENVCHQTGIQRFLLDFGLGGDRTARTALAEPLLQRFIGAIYRPETENCSHYSTASLSRQYDAWVWFDETNAVEPPAK